MRTADEHFAGDPAMHTIRDVLGGRGEGGGVLGKMRLAEQRHRQRKGAGVDVFQGEHPRLETMATRL